MQLTWTSTPLFIAHRGLSANYPENTLAAFEAAFAAGARALEFDVQRAACGTPVIIHDYDLDRTTNGSGIVTHKTWQELATLDAGSWFDPKFSSVSLPSLQQFVTWLHTHPMLVNIELKVHVQEDCPELIGSIIKIIREQWPKTSPLPVLSSFSNKAMQTSLELAPDLMRAVLAEGYFDQQLDFAQRINATYININDKLASVANIAKAKKHGLGVNVFTINDAKIAKQLFAHGAGGVFSDNAPELQKLIG